MTIDNADRVTTLVNDLIPGTDDPIVWYEGSGTSDRRFLHADERGSIVSLTNASGTVLAINSYDEYGIPASGNIGRFQYTGQQWLPEIGLYHYKARMYSPTLGRFMQTDPIGYADGMNWYAYVGGDPVNFVDPLGLIEVCSRTGGGSYESWERDEDGKWVKVTVVVAGHESCVTYGTGDSGGGNPNPRPESGGPQSTPEPVCDSAGCMPAPTNPPELSCDALLDALQTMLAARAPVAIGGLIVSAIPYGKIPAAAANGWLGLNTYFLVERARRQGCIP